MKFATCISGAAAFLITTSAIPAAVAETVEIPVAAQGQHLNIKTPRKGISQKKVIEQFGEPINTSGPVGEPPITRWNYSNFTVYFEHDHVIHSVLKHETTPN